MTNSQKQSAQAAALIRNAGIRRDYGVEEYVVREVKSSMNKHTWYECKCNNHGCQFCDGGLGLCTVCNGAEGTLTTECCGRKITEEEKEKIYTLQSLDFVDGVWIEKPLEVRERMSESDKDKRIAELERTVTRLRWTLFVLSRWGLDNGLPFALFDRAQRNIDVADNVRGKVKERNKWAKQGLPKKRRRSLDGIG